MVSNCFEVHGRYAYKDYLLRAQSALNKAVDKVPIDRTKGLSMGTLSTACGNPDGIAAFETMKMKYLPCGKCEIMPFGHCKMFRLCGIQSTFFLSLPVMVPILELVISFDIFFSLLLNAVLNKSG